MPLYKRRLNCFLWLIDALILCFLQLGIMQLCLEMRSKFIFWEDIISKDIKDYLFFIDMIIKIENGSK